jgi:hypothetical protein
MIKESLILISVFLFTMFSVFMLALLRGSSSILSFLFQSTITFIVVFIGIMIFVAMILNFIQ